LFFSLHYSGIFNVEVVMANQVEHPVHNQQGHFPQYSVVPAPGLPESLRVGEDDLS
jgi:hypothetical protein